MFIVLNKQEVCNLFCLSKVKDISEQKTAIVRNRFLSAAICGQYRKEIEDLGLKQLVIEVAD